MTSKLAKIIRGLWTRWVEADLYKPAVMVAPERIWLKSAQDHSGDLFFSDDDAHTWSEHRSGTDDVEYVRLDVAMRMQSENANTTSNRLAA